ncbi:MAG: sigma 54-interacting transcriptional regulator [Treponema sp.]|jgi:Nif-specific regulatory protein|nr:sigma 54-interacting transcriptional regulator [Treponema sp.]
MCHREGEGLGLLFEISQVLAASVQLETILKPVLDRIATYLGIIRGMITILNRDKGEIAIAEAWGLEGSQKVKGRYSLGEGITGRVIETGTPVAIPRIADEPRFLNRTGARNRAEAKDMSFVCVPIKIGPEVIGAISIDLLYTPEPLDYEVCILTIVAASISQAVRFHQGKYEEMEALKAENSRLHEALRTRYDRPVIGNSMAMQRLYQQMDQVSGTNATVLILGESGAGKERIAHAIHDASPRAVRPFVILNCAAIPENLIESTLFGHEKGAFTGAVSRRIGYFEQADLGTMFLDEIAELPLSTQSKFLRVLQEREFERIGGTETIKVNIRVIAATNRDLPKLIQEGAFREDLYYRLSVFPLRVPPLRERKIDILLLADHFVKKFSAEHHKPIHHISSSARTLMTEYPWPGNVRELENCIERAVILSTGDSIHGCHLPPQVQHGASPGSPQRQTLKEAVESVERELIAAELRWTRGNVSRAAQHLGISERVMGLRVKKYQLKGITGRFP